MTANIQYKGTDLDNIYENPILGAATTTRNYQVAGVDISSRYTALANVTTGNGNIATRIPPTGILTSAGTDLSSVFAGKPSQYSTTTLAMQRSSLTQSIGTTQTLTHVFTINFASAAALTNYFTYGGRIQIVAGNIGDFATGTADANLQTMLSSMGEMIIYDAGHYRTGVGGTVSNAAIGGQNIGTTSTSLYLLTGAAPYGSCTYTIAMVANAASGSATVLTFTITLTLVQSGVVADSYDGVRTSTVQQRNYAGSVTPTQSAPTYTLTSFNW